MNETIVIGIVNSSFALIGLIFTGMMAYFTAKLNVKADKAVVETKEVKEKLEASESKSDSILKNISNTSNDIHTLVNSNMGVQLKITMLLADRVANLTKEPLDYEAANVAHQAYDEHMKKQAVVEERKKRGG